MKSIMEEASTILKAIDKGWQKAGKPKEFSIKIFEEPQRNFIGLTVKPAKIAVFFNDSPAPKPAPAHRNRPAQQRVSPQREKQAPQRRDYQQAKPAAQTGYTQQQNSPEKITRQQEITERNAPERNIPDTQERQNRTHEHPRAQQPVWSESMLQDVQTWLRESLAFVSVRPLTFTLDNQHFYLKINFAEPVFEDRNREKQLFSSLSILLLQLLKNKYKRPLKGYKIILLS